MTRGPSLLLIKRSFLRLDIRIIEIIITLFRQILTILRMKICVLNVMTKLLWNTFPFPVPTVVPENVNVVTYNGTAVTVLWTPVPDTHKDMKGVVQGYQVSISVFL